MKKIFYLFFFLYFTSHVQAATLNLQEYSNARTVFHSEGQEDSFLLALGVYKKVDGRWRVDKSQYLSGFFERTTFELPADHTAENGFSFFKEQLSMYNLRELFYCKARDCGTSNSWANNYFKIIQLYGLDQYQFYGVYEVTNVDKNPSYVVLYAVVRGNKRAYVQLDILHVSKVIN